MPNLKMIWTKEGQRTTCNGFYVKANLNES